MGQTEDATISARGSVAVPRRQQPVRHKSLQVTLGVLTAFGGMVDIGNLVANPEAGGRFQMSLAWVVVLGVCGTMVYTEMAGRVSEVTGQAAFDVVRDRLPARLAKATVVATVVLTLMTASAEIGGIGIVGKLAFGSGPRVWLVPAAVALALIVWKLPFSAMEHIFGLLGLALIATVVTLVALRPHWSHLLGTAVHPNIPPRETVTTYSYFAVAQLASVMIPYQLIFFSSGALEEDWDGDDIALQRSNVFIGYPLGAVLALSLMAIAAVVYAPHHVEIQHLDQVVGPTRAALGHGGFALLLIGMLATMVGAALETTLSVAYATAQQAGWRWGKREHPSKAPAFYTVALAAVVIAAAAMAAGLDPIQLTNYSLVLSTVALPLTLYPLLKIGRDASIMGRHVNHRWSHAVAVGYLGIAVVAGAVAIPLLLVTHAGK